LLQAERLESWKRCIDFHWITCSVSMCFVHLSYHVNCEN